ncbi:hypothetical protein, partial [Nostoc sp.]|uniref:hypothetical protein n=1 Tax=Nostoc sp. TaxID=1180 RepID=UPI002FFBE994
MAEASRREGGSLKKAIAISTIELNLGILRKARQSKGNDLNGTKKSYSLYRISATDFQAIKQCRDGAGDC